jgi:DNA mismatch repair protein MutS
MSVWLNQAVGTDLGLDRPLDDPLRLIDFAAFVPYLTDDIEVLSERQKVLSELLEKPGLEQALEEFVAVMDQCRTIEGIAAEENSEQMFRTAGLLLEYRRVIEQLSQLLEEETFSSQWFQILRDHVVAVKKSNPFLSLCRWIDDCLEGYHDPVGGELVLFFDEFLNYRSVLLKGIHSKGYEGGKFSNATDLSSGEKMLSRLEQLPNKENLSFRTIVEVGAVSNDFHLTYTDKSYDKRSIFQAVLAECVRLGLVSMKRNAILYLKDCSEQFQQIHGEIQFYTNALVFCRKMEQAGMPMCFPQFAPAKEKVLCAKEAYLPELVVKYGASAKSRIVCNDLSLTGEGGTLVITGANTGGKTTFLKTAGVVQFFAQLGMKVPAKSAVVSPVDAIVSMFSRAEDDDEKFSRFQTEVLSTLELLQSLTSNSLVLLNEPFTSTSPEDGIKFCRRLLSVVLRLQSRCILVTHFFALAEAQTYGMPDAYTKNIHSLIAVVDKTEAGVIPTHRFIEAPPEYTSYAAEIMANRAEEKAW